MLKLKMIMAIQREHLAAAFGRLCVETVFIEDAECDEMQPPSGGCVLKQEISK